MLNSAYLKKLRCQLKEIAAASRSLSDAFAEEWIRVNWRDEASRLKALHSSIREQLDQVRRNENAASCGHSRTKLTVSLCRLAVGTIRMVSKSQQLVSFSDHLLDSFALEQRPFGRVLVCVGPKGMPDDVQVVSISGLARESHREEAEVINELKGHGYLLYSEKAFSLLIDKLARDVQEGRLPLPISRDKLTEIGASSCLKLEAEKSG